MERGWNIGRTGLLGLMGAEVAPAPDQNPQERPKVGITSGPKEEKGRRYLPSDAEILLP